MVISHTSSFCTVVLFSPILLRIIFGRFSSVSMIGVYYTYRFFSLLILSLLTIKTVLKTTFISHFDTMSNMSDNTVLLAMIPLSVLATLPRVVYEICVKTYAGTPHIGRLALFTFLGAEEADINPKPWGMESFLVSTAVYAISLIVYMVVRYRRNRRSQGILESNQTSRIESSANGITSWASVASLVMAVVFLLVWRQARQVKELGNRTVGT